MGEKRKIVSLHEEVLRCRSDDPVMLAAAKIELDVFTGGPNPSWTLAENAIRQWLRSMPVVNKQPSRPEGLGYRGIIVHLQDQDIRVFDGIIVTPNAALVDPARKFESWLLESGANAADPTLLASVRQAF